MVPKAAASRKDVLFPKETLYAVSLVLMAPVNRTKKMCLRMLTSSDTSSLALIYLPVECGEQACSYGNLCVAAASGFGEEECAQAEAEGETVPPTEGLTMSEQGTVSPSGEASLVGSADPTTMEESTCPLPGYGVCGGCGIAC